MILEILLDTLIDSIKMLPFLLVAYFVIEYLERVSSDKIDRILVRGGKVGFIPGAALGLLPQCGFSGMAADLYSGNVITPGTLCAVFIATSDEALPLLIAMPEKWSVIAPLLIAKFIFAIIAGVITDYGIRKMFPALFNGGYSGSDTKIDCHDHDEEEGLLKATVRHTAIIISSIFIILFAVNLLVEYLGEERLAAFISNAGPWQIFISALIGMIPNCASSVLLTQMFAKEQLSFAAAFAGLSAGSGIGTLILLRTEKNKKRALAMLLLIYIYSVAAGLILRAFGISF